MTGELLLGKLNLRKFREQPELLLPGEAEMIQKWLDMEAAGEELPTTYDPNDPIVARQRIKKMPYYNK